MNQEKAKEIVIKGESFKLEKDKSYQLEEIISLSTAKWKEFHEAKGYLEAVKKTKGLVKAIHWMSGSYDFQLEGKARKGYEKIVLTALAKWEKDV